MPNALLIGTGEYTTGYVHGKTSTSDKTAGVVALTFFHLRARKRIQNISFCGTNGTKFPALRKHFIEKIEKPYGLETKCITFPEDHVEFNPFAYKTAISTMKKGDLVVVTTPDDTHFDICLAAIRQKCHVMCTKPFVKTLKHHQTLLEEARKAKTLVCVEFHKRFDPIYHDAVQRIQDLGEFNYFSSYMSQPISQLVTFKHWAGISSDISYYLNSHHVDICCWALQGRYQCTKVTAAASRGIGETVLDRKMEDTIVLMTEWTSTTLTKSATPKKNTKSATPKKNTKSVGTAVFTASWITPKADVHSQQKFHYMGAEGEIRIDQAHRGFQLCTHKAGLKSINPLYMRYTPEDGKFVGEQGYGYQSFLKFVDAVDTMSSDGRIQKNSTLASLETTLQQTAILEAGRRSLDEQKPIIILWQDNNPIGFQ